MIEIILSIDNELYRIDGALEEYQELSRKKFNEAINSALEQSQFIEKTEPTNLKFELITAFSC